MFIWATAADGLVPVQHSLLMGQALAEKKIPFEMHIFENGDHGLSLCTQASSGDKTQIDRDAAEWAALAERFLVRRMPLELDEYSSWTI